MAQAESKIYLYTSTGDKEPLIAPDRYDRFNVRLTPTGSSAKLQHTITPRDVVVLDPSLATWVDWPDGTVIEGTNGQLIGAPTAIRVSVVSGTNVKLEVNFT